MNEILDVNLHFNNVQVNAGEPIKIQDKTFLFVNTKNQVLKGDNQLKILDKGFFSAKESKSNNYIVLSPQAYHVTL